VKISLKIQLISLVSFSSFSQIQNLYFMNTTRGICYQITLMAIVAVVIHCIFHISRYKLLKNLNYTQNYIIAKLKVHTHSGDGF